MRVAGGTRPRVCWSRVRACGPATLLLLGGLALSGCGGASPPAAPGRPGPAAAAAMSQGGGAPAGTGASAAPAAAGVARAAGARGDMRARLDGFGPLRLGMSVDEAERAWPGLFASLPGGPPQTGCFHANGAGHGGPPYFAYMFDGGRFVRYGGSNEDIAAPGGGRRGMREARLRALYHGALAQAPDPFAEGGKLLSIEASGVAPSKLVFVVRPDGVVNEWRVGLHPQVDYASACEDAGD